MKHVGRYGDGLDNPSSVQNYEHSRIITTPSRDEAIRSGKLILLATSQRADRVLIRRQLRRLGYAADTVDNGLGAISALMRTPYALLLADCIMPEMEGFELARRIRRLEPRSTHLPIIALIANDAADHHSRSLAAGMDDSLVKPVGMAALGARLLRWIPAEPTEAEIVSHHLSTGVYQDAGPALNLTLLADYSGDDPEGIMETLNCFMVGMKSDIERLAAAVVESDAEQVQLLAHRIKGAARAVGGAKLVHFSESVESATTFRDWATIRSTLPRLTEAGAEIDRICRSLIAGQGAHDINPYDILHG
jgi:CheY-like chemotaxis protein